MERKIRRHNPGAIEENGLQPGLGQNIIYDGPGLLQISNRNFCAAVQ